MLCKDLLTTHKHMCVAIVQENTIYKNRFVGVQIWSMGHSLLPSEVHYQVFSNQNFSYPLEFHYLGKRKANLFSFLYSIRAAS